MPEGKGNPPQTPGAKTVPMTAEDQILVKGFLANGVGEGLIRALEPMARRDLHPGNLIIGYNKVTEAIDISIVFIETNTQLWSNLQSMMWRQRMTWRFDNSGPQLMLVVRWFLPYDFRGFPFDKGKETVHVPGPDGKPKITPADDPPAGEPPVPPPLESMEPSFEPLVDTPLKVVP